MSRRESDGEEGGGFELERKEGGVGAHHLFFPVWLCFRPAFRDALMPGVKYMSIGLGGGLANEVSESHRDNRLLLLEYELRLRRDT